MTNETRFARGVLAVVAAAVVLTGFTSPAMARSWSTYTPEFYSYSVWLGDEVNAIDAQSNTVDAKWAGVLRRHHKPVIHPFWDVDGIPVFVGPARWLARQGQHMAEVVKDMEDQCDMGAHIPLPWVWDPKYPNTDVPDRIIVLTRAVWYHGCEGLGGGKSHALSAKTVEIALDHEIIENLVDPDHKFKLNAHRVEIADPVQAAGYQDASNAAVWLSDFVFPSYCTDGTSPYDYLGTLHHGVAKRASAC